MIAFGFAFLIVVSNAAVYISRRVLSSTTELFDILLSSWLFTAKCFGHAATPLLWIPVTYAAAISPAR